MSIIISDLSYRYPNQLPLFEHLNLSVGTNRKISVIGNNGCGKSTLFQIIFGTLKGDTQYIKFNNNILKNQF